MKACNKELEKLCNELEKLGEFECCNRHYYDITLDDEATSMGFDVYYLGEPAIKIKIEGQEIYDDKKMLNELHSVISKRIKLWKFNKKMAKLKEDFE